MAGLRFKSSRLLSPAWTVSKQLQLSHTQVFLYQQPIDFRKAHLGLCGIIECEPGHDPFAGHLYAFTNKRRNKIKCLFWEDNGFVLYYKSLSEEKFKCPKPEDKLITLTKKSACGPLSEALACRS
jgi:transposase